MEKLGNILSTVQYYNNVLYKNSTVTEVTVSVITQIDQEFLLKNCYLSVFLVRCIINSYGTVQFLKYKSFDLLAVQAL